MKLAKEVLEYLKFERLNLHNIIGENDSEFNKGRFYVMNKIIESIEELISIEEREDITKASLKEANLIIEGKLPKKTAKEFLSEISDS